MPRIVFFKEDGGAAETAEVGGKGASLIKLYRASIPVPDGFVVTTSVYREYNHSEMPESFKQELLAAFDTLDATRVAVRSSATSEDSDTASWAGQFESFMNVDKDNLAQRILDCWGSVSGAARYAETQSLRQDELVVAVVVQKMVDSDVSGVAFSINPVSHSADEIMVEATYGLGELLVQGMITPDNYVLSKSDRSVLSKRMGNKTSMLVYQEGETKEVPVAADIQETACLSDEQLQELGDLVRRVEDYYQSPQDIEWALKDDRFYILQSRPITTV